MLCVCRLGSVSPASDAGGGGGGGGGGGERPSRKTSSTMRSEVLGKMEDNFDSLMGEVRDTDPTAVLRKVRAAICMYR